MAAVLPHAPIAVPMVYATTQRHYSLLRVPASGKFLHPWKSFEDLGTGLLPSI